MSRRRALRITAVAGIGGALGGGLVTELLRRGRLRRVTETRDRLGTLVTLTAVHPDRAEARAAVASAFAELERLEAILSRHDPASPLARLNRAGTLDPAPPELLEVLAEARRVHRLTRGAFDPTVLPLLDLWERARAGDGEAPHRDALQEARGRVGLDGVRVQGDRVIFLRPGMALTLDGIAKGRVVDGTVASLVSAGAERVLVDAGGDMASGGPGAPSEPWLVAVQDPRNPGRAAGHLHLAGEAVATSGDYLRAFTPDRRHHHILDPRTGRSPDHTASVTVRAPTALEADALSTALLVLRPEEGVQVLETTPGTAALVVGKDGRRHATAGWG